MPHTTDASIPVFLDCDTGIDDALALGYLLAAPQVNLVGVGSVHGNVSASGGAENTLRLLGMAGRSGVPVAVGASEPVAGNFGGGAVEVHGGDGVGGVRDRLLPAADAMPVGEDAADMLIRLSHEYGHHLRVIAIGPLTNLAIALERDPDLAGRVGGVTAMGGAALEPGNVRPAAEANIFNDPEAAQIVVSASWPVTLVPLDVTMQHTFEASHIGRLQSSGVPVVEAIGEMLDFYSGFYESVCGRRCCALHDPLAAAIALGEVSLVRAPRVPVVVDDSAGPGRGQTICDMRDQRNASRNPDGTGVDVDGANVRVVLEAEVAPGKVSGGSFADLLVARLLEL